MAIEKDYIGKELTWQEAVDLFPNYWVAFKNCTFNNLIFQKGILVDVINDSNIENYMKEHWEEKLHIERTTEESEDCYLHGVLIEEIS